MKAIVQPKYGPPDVLQFREVDTPVPGDHDVLVEIHAASVNAADWHLLTADIFLVRLVKGLLKPNTPILGSDIAGRVAAIGRHVREFQPGDEVFGNVFSSGNGGFAEYVVAPASALARKPIQLSYEQAAAIPLAANTALQGLRDSGNLQPGQKVLIQGAAGGVGTYAVQIAKALGAEVTAVCSTRNLEQARSIGADHLIDYTNADFTRSGRRYDLIFAVNGYHPLSAYARALTPNGTYVMAGGSPAQMFESLLLSGWMSATTGRKFRTASEKANAKDLALLKELAESGKLVPVIDRRYPLEETAEALRYLGQGHARGKVVITVDHSATARP